MRLAWVGLIFVVVLGVLIGACLSPRFAHWIGCRLSVVCVLRKSPEEVHAARIARAYGDCLRSLPVGRQVDMTEVAAFGDGVTGFAVWLASRDMNEARVWYSDAEETWSARFMRQYIGRDERPERIADFSDPTKPVIDPTFAAMKPKAWAVVVNIPAKVDARLYPVVWTRGLRGNRWEKDSPFKGQGGWVGYLDGHACWHDDTLGDDGKGVFITPDGRRTASITEVIGPGAVVLEDN